MAVRRMAINPSAAGDSALATFFKGRVALFAILEALGISAGDEVLLPAFTCVVVPLAIVFAGARPVYLDIDPETYNLDCNGLQDAVSARTRALVVQHTFGLPAPMDQVSEHLSRCATTRPIAVIEDCAHTLDACYRGRAVGSLGTAAFFSSQWSKPFTTGLGGFATASDPDLAHRLARLHERYPAPSWKTRALLRCQFAAYRACYSSTRYWALMSAYRWLGAHGLALASSSPAELDLRRPPTYATRMGAAQHRRLTRGLGDVALRQRDAAHRNLIARSYEHALAPHGFAPPRQVPGSKPVFLRYPVRVGNKNEILNKARYNRIELGDWFVSPLHPIRHGLDALGYRSDQCPQAESACREVINLPTHADVTPAMAETIARFVYEHARPVG